MTKETAADFIIFATIQACGAQDYGFTRNECCRNLKIALHQYWQNKILKQHGQAHFHKIPRSEAADKLSRADCVVEHSVPQMTIVNLLMDMETPFRREKVIDLLERLFTVIVVTREEHSLLNSSGYRSSMPNDWDGRDPFARYTKLGIKVIKNAG